MKFERLSLSCFVGVTSKRPPDSNNVTSIVTHSGESRIWSQLPIIERLALWNQTLYREHHGTRVWAATRDELPHDTLIAAGRAPQGHTRRL